MAVFELLMPKMGESIIEATIIAWLKSEGDEVTVDETILEIATDKVDSEIPSPVSGTIQKILHHKDEVVAIGTPLALIETDAAISVTDEKPSSPPTKIDTPKSEVIEAKKQPSSPQPTASLTTKPVQLTRFSIENKIPSNADGRFYSPLVRNIARAEGITLEELASIPGSGSDQRVTKYDLLNYIDQKKLTRQTYQAPVASRRQSQNTQTAQLPPKEDSLPSASSTPTVQTSGDEEIIEMSRMRKVIAGHMRNSLDTSAHVTTFVEADATRLVNWRNKIKAAYVERFSEKITLSPLFAEVVIQALREHPGINASLSGDNLVVKKNINLGIATAMKNGNLIVPVIHNAEQLNLHGLTKKLNDLTGRARENKLKPEEIQGGTFTISNIGTFGNVMGTPIINQPQLAILALGAIKKKPVIQETSEGDIIAIRHMMYLSLSFDHRVIDGYQGGIFLNRIAHHIENFDSNRPL